MKKRYEIILLDADGTLFDFDKCSAAALEDAFGASGLSFGAQVPQAFHVFNDQCWSAFERGEMSKEQVKVRRFERLFEAMGVSCDAQLFAPIFQGFLAQKVCEVDGAQAVVSRLAKNHRLYVVTNGVEATQNARFGISPMGKHILKIFVSEQIGYPKPHIEYFKRVFCQIEDFAVQKALIVGDSLATDIEGGVRAGLDTCWFNPSRSQNTSGFEPTYEIDRLEQLLDICDD